ncbi:MAG: 50S ribosomal protein L1 [Dehalococcoidia bacterium]|nr:50S ribosomal protein L1 [Dehalococcoidia bacterium]MCA9849695.1 50S ribosomal protein L1 [Dehalococcoidia bacterium]MCA9856977.1 50S ribosomal protein L1 [Dehalococcoidia bacterium]MCB9482468.1 50S ribosomal protein L1 [Dehalococcoidia bacterium]MCB9491287.1 50S ribosomal protein L1 [Dehalococcoidia bacterium]
MPKTSKRISSLREKVDATKTYGVDEAIQLVKELATAKFDETVELHIRTGLDGRHADQQLRGSVVLPHGIGKEVKVAVFAEGEAATAAQNAGADVVGGDDLIARVQGGFTDFDVAIAQRELMGKVGGLGRVLGPRGLMPNPRNNTVLGAEDIARGVEEAKAGRVDFRLDRSNLIHVILGKVSFTPEQLADNLRAMVTEIERNRPAGAKGELVRGVSITSTMGPGLNLDLAALKAVATAGA